MSQTVVAEAETDSPKSERRTRFDPPHSYLDFARVGRSGHGWYLLGTLLIAFAAAVLGLIATGVVTGVAFEASGRRVLTGTEEWPDILPGTTGLPSWVELLFAIVGFAGVIPAVLLVTRYVHGRPWRSVITPFTRLDWGLVGRGALMWAIPNGLMILIGFLLWPEDATWQYDPGEFWPYALVGLLFIGVQTSAEELFARGYLAQWAARTFRSIWFVSVVTALPFGLAHWSNAEALGYGDSNGELALGLSSYVLVGFVWAWVSYTSGTVELAIGAHYINNLMVLLILSTPDFPFAGALFAAEAPSAAVLAVYSLVSCGAFWLLVRRARGRGEPMPLAPVGHRARPMVLPAPPAGWYPDPVGVAPTLRYWNGSAWTEHTHPGFAQPLSTGA